MHPNMDSTIDEKMTVAIIINYVIIHHNNMICLAICDRPAKINHTVAQKSPTFSNMTSNLVTVLEIENGF